MDDLLQLHFNEVVEGVDVLLDQAFDFEEGREQVPFVFGRVDRVGEVLVVVEGLQQRLKAVVGFRELVWIWWCLVFVDIVINDSY